MKHSELRHQPRHVNPRIQVLVKKFKMLAEHASDEHIRSKMMEISDKHQEHFNELFSKLS